MMHDDHDNSESSAADAWADHVNDAYYDKMGAEFGRKTRDRINWMCAQTKGSSVLDVGCSQGIASILMAREGMRVVGVDIYAPAINYALAERSKEIETVAARLEFRCADLAALDGERFDTVVMGEVIEHQTNPGRFVENAANFVADGGRLVITVPFGLHPWPDHKSTIFPKDLYTAVADSFRMSHLDIKAGYIRMVLDRHPNGNRRNDDDKIALLIATENGAIEVQERFYEANAKVQALDKVKGELNAKLQQLEQARGGLAQEVALQKALSVQASRAISELEGSKQSLVRNLEESRSRHDHLKQQHDDLKQQYDDLKQQYDGLVRQCDHLKQSNVSLQDERDQAQVGCNVAETKFSALQREFGELSSERNLIQERIGVLQGERDQAICQAGEIKDMLSRQQHVCAALERELSEAREVAAQHRAREDSQDERSRSLEAELAVAQHKRNGHYLHLEAERRRTRTLLPLLQNLHRENQLYQQSIALGIGRAVLGLRNPRGVIAFPSRLYRVWCDYRGRGGGDVVVEPLVLPKFEPAMLPSLTKSSRQSLQEGGGTDPATGGSNPPVATVDTKQALSVLGWAQEIRPSTIPVASVLDEFSRACFAPQASLIEPRPDNWEALLEAYAPKFLLVESSWKGNHGTWQYRVANYANPPGQELSEMVEGFRSRGIPTVFWNKEDPVHFDNFIKAAAQFDVILTTAAEVVPKYQEWTRAQVGVLQFAAEEGLHNPIGSAERNGKVCFAGSFYANRFHERRDDQLMLLDAATEFDFDIFDRNHDPEASARSDFDFPERFSPFIRGRMPYAAIGRAYREYKVFLNVNSVVDSPTMFSRRVFELLACGTPVVSTWSRGTEETFGDDLIWHVHSREEAVEAIRLLLSDDREWRRRSLAGIRAVLSRHTFRHRFHEILELVGMRDRGADPSMAIQVVSEVASEKEVDSVLASFERQQTGGLTDKRLLLLTKAGITPSIDMAGVDVLPSARNLSEALMSSKTTKGDRLIAVFSPEVVYGPNHLQDLMLAERYSKAAVVGKPEDGRRSSEYRFGVPLDWRTLLFREERLASSGGLLEAMLSDLRSAGSASGQGRIFAVDSSGFAAGHGVIGRDRHSEALAERGA